MILARYVGSDPNAQLSYLETDHLGTPRVAIGVTSGAVQWRWDLLQAAFGDHAPISLVPGFELDTRYPGQYFDKESGLHYNYFRDYEAGTGRYIESGPIGLEGGISTFAYGEESPLTNVDPYGLESYSSHQDRSARVAAVFTYQLVMVDAGDLLVGAGGSGGCGVCRHDWTFARGLSASDEREKLHPLRCSLGSVAPAH